MVDTISKVFLIDIFHVKVHQSDSCKLNSEVVEFSHRQKKNCFRFPINHQLCKVTTCAMPLLLPSRICHITLRISHFRSFVTLNSSSQDNTGQNLTEKIVQHYATNLPP